MARVLLQTLNVARGSVTTRLLPFRLVNRRGHCSGHPAKSLLVEVDLGTAGNEKSGSDVEAVMMRQLEEAMQLIVILRATPDWLPFRPGFSFWVPPHSRQSLLRLRALAGMASDSMTMEENLSVSSGRGWPSSSYFIDGGPPNQVNENSENGTTESDDNEEED
ncbi:hypothetical protein DsansV1_C34g0224841 [Dioscorea sansibarensis]